MGELRARIRSERLALVDFLGTLSAEEWATPSLCEGWTVQDVAAHLACAPPMSVPRAYAELARSGFRLNRMIADTAARWSRRGPAAIIEQLRANAETGAKPIGMPEVAILADAVIHPLDIRRPLGKEPRSLPLDVFVPAADWLSAARWPMTAPLGGGARRRLEGVRLVADDLPWASGTGEELHGSSVALMLLLSNRPVGEDELTGPGVAVLGGG
jgi:uncharacterized protein (TIGR03083 family)